MRRLEDVVLLGCHELNHCEPVASAEVEQIHLVQKAPQILLFPLFELEGHLASVREDQLLDRQLLANRMKSKVRHAAGSIGHHEVGLEDRLRSLGQLRIVAAWPEESLYQLEGL